MRFDLTKYILLFLWLASNLLQGISNFYKVPSNDEEYFLNPLVNYSFTFETEENRNNSIYTNSYIKLSYGSLITTQLLKDEELSLQLPLNEKLVFSTNYRNYVTRHLSYDAKEFHDHALGVKQQIEYLAAIRKAVGDDVDLILECHISQLFELFRKILVKDMTPEQNTAFPNCFIKKII